VSLHVLSLPKTYLMVGRDSEEAVVPSPAQVVWGRSFPSPAIAISIRSDG
jgi:hypothetical protein